MSQPLLVVVTGLPGSGKSTLAGALADRLDAVLLSLDEVKEELFGVSGPSPHELRFAAEAALFARLMDATGPVVIDIWVAPGRDDERVAGRLRTSDRRIVELRCVVAGEVAATRYASRVRGGPHLPADESTLQRIRDATEALRPLGVGIALEVDTSEPVDVEAIADEIAGVGGFIEPG